MKKLLLLFLLLGAASPLVRAQLTVRGRVLSAQDGQPLPGATVQLKNTPTAVTTDARGEFALLVPAAPAALVFTYIGYQPQQLTLAPPFQETYTVRLREEAGTLQEVTVATGYQEIPRERATGSFAQVDQDLLQRRVSPDVLSRLEDVVPGLLTNRSGNRQLTIRGQSTLFASSEPLIVVDNFPYEGDLASLNPNDVESVTVLKDAAAASIWGARAGNGVIVITTKRGRYAQPTQVSLHSNVTVGARPDVFYQPVLSTADYIDLEQQLFGSGFYASTEAAAARTPLTPVVELLIARRDGQVDAAEAERQLEEWKQYDVRNDYERYFYRQSVNQQYALNVRGGSERQRYYLSAGYDRNAEALVGNRYSRATLRASQTYRLLKDRLQLTGDLFLTQTRDRNDNPGTALLGMTEGNTTPLYPYARLADDNGTPLATVRGYRVGTVAQAAAAGLLDWTYKPLEEIALADDQTKGTDYRLNVGASLQLLPSLQAELSYQYGRDLGERRQLRSQDTWYTRNQINRLTAVQSNGTLVRPLPLGAIVDFALSDYTYQNARAQLNYSHTWGQDHDLRALAGAEGRDQRTATRGSRLYGYDPAHATSQVVNYVGTFPLYVNPLSSGTIANGDYTTELTDRYRSFFANASYTFRRRYVLYASGRLDQSNLFGVETNQKGVPLWSAGTAWHLNEEPFYRLGALPTLTLRASYGVSGNVDKTLSAYTTARYNSGSGYLTKLPYADIVNPPNPALRWERVQTLNLGLDFALQGDRLSGTLELYRKAGKDLIGNTPYAPSTGIVTFRGNYADTRGRGLDLTLNAVPLAGKFRWTTTWWLSVAREEVTHYTATGTGAQYITQGLSYPQEGRPITALYSYAWAGLHPQTGDPQGYLEGDVSTDYAKIISGATADNIVYHGPSRPPVFGAFRPTFSYQGLSLSANLSYRLGYYFRRPSVTYYGVLSGTGGHGDYARRWQQPGDEQTTQVPSLPAARNTNRDTFYTYSAVLVERGDHVRLQDVQLSYAFPRSSFPRLPFARLEVYAYANNLGLLWKATDSGYDPDYPNAAFPPARTLAAGLRVDF